MISQKYILFGIGIIIILPILFLVSIDFKTQNYQLSVIEQVTHNPFFDEKLHVLFLYRYYNLQNMDRWFLHIVEAAERNPNIHVVGIFGEGWEGWNYSLSVLDNILHKYPEKRIDIVHCHEWHQPPESAHTFIRSMFFHELQCFQGIQYCEDLEYNRYLEVTFFAYANTAPYLFSHSKNHLFIHLPHAACNHTFYHPIEAERDIDILLVGKITGLYPLRKKLHDWIDSGQIPGQIREHPGYHEAQFKTENEKYHNHTAQTQLMDYAQQLKRSKIVYMCSSMRKFALRKYVEASLSGALIVADIPAERQGEFRKYVVEIDLDDTPESISAKVNYYLKNNQERVKRARIGQQISMANYTYDSFVNRLIDGWNRFKKGQRGMYLPHPFEMIKPWCVFTHSSPVPDCGFVGWDPYAIAQARK